MPLANQGMDFAFAGANEVEKIMRGNSEVWGKRLSISLPQQSGTLNLETYINTNNPNGKKYIKITNVFTQPKIITGNLSAFDEVEFVNNGEVQGNAVGGNAFEITSALKLTNNGWIRGAGGNGGLGGAGGTGANDTYTLNTTTYQYAGGCSGNLSAWYDQDGSNNINLWWNGSRQDYTTTSTGPLTISGQAGVFYRDIYKERTFCDLWSDTYQVRRVVTTYPIRYGGGGGIGGSTVGTGQIFGQANTSGSGGLGGALSSPTGGNSGGTGGTAGTGGTWGNTGGTGGTGGTGFGGGSAGSSGTSGTSGGNSITGSGFLISGSVTGSVNGGIS